ncbi:MAG: 3-dehydroquinate synthase [Verrucomicrobiota bacterium]
MSRHDFQIQPSFKHRVVFTRAAFSSENPALAEILAEGGGRRAIVIIEKSVATAWPSLAENAATYLKTCGVDCRGAEIFSGGETVKADEMLVREICALIHDGHIDRHSYLLAIGGGAFLDAVGFAAAIAHRGVRLIRFPTTTLSQDDSGVGVKCGINGFGKKNWFGSFAVPFAVINDFAFLHTQDEETRRSGLIEAVKVALVKDAGFFRWIEENSAALAALEPDALEQCVERSAFLHARHIATGGDPFETGSSRPLDFGHWAAHKLEAISGCTVPHAKAVAVGIALDSLYAEKAGIAAAGLATRVHNLLCRLGLPLWHEQMAARSGGELQILEGIDEFREHLGGDLTILMPEDIGRCRDVHEIDSALIVTCLKMLSTLSGNAAECRNTY